MADKRGTEGYRAFFCGAHLTKPNQTNADCWEPSLLDDFWELFSKLAISMENDW